MGAAIRYFGRLTTLMRAKMEIPPDAGSHRASHSYVRPDIRPATVFSAIVDNILVTQDGFVVSFGNRAALRGGSAPMVDIDAQRVPRQFARFFDNHIE
jgi:hypothetical protein